MSAVGRYAVDTEPGHAEWTHSETGLRVVAEQLHAWWHLKVVDRDGRRLASLGFEQSPRGVERAARNWMSEHPDGEFDVEQPPAANRGEAF